MALISRISRLFKADFHAVLDQIEEPEQLLKQAIREMEDEIALSERHLKLGGHDQQQLRRRQDELAISLVEIDAETDLCFLSGKEDLAKSLVRKKLETQRLVKHLVSRSESLDGQLSELNAVVEENRATLEGLRQKAEILASRAPERRAGAASFDDTEWPAHDLRVSEDEVEIAWLRVQERGNAS
jgi:phage shock protein A